MRLHFLGVGSAFDENHTNISMILQADGKNILLDCGYDVPHEYFKHYDEDFLDTIWISHPHADHYFGLGMLIRLKSEGRTKPLHIITRPEVKTYIREAIELSYPGSFDDIPFDLEFVEFEGEMEWEGIDFRIAPTEHPVPNKALRVDFDGKSICYSGDGKPTEAGKELYDGVDLLVHETFFIDEEHENHGNIREVADIVKEKDIKKVAAVHLHRDTRSKEKEVRDFIESRDEEILLPEEGDILEV